MSATAARSTPRSRSEIGLGVVAAAGDEVALRRIETALAADGITLLAKATGANGVEPGGSAPDAVVLACGRSITSRKADIHELGDRLPGARVVLVMPTDTRGGVRSALEAGADGVVFDADLEQSLAATVRAACSGQVVVPSARRHEVDRPTLSQRERQALGMVVMGFTNREIANRLYLAESTVKCHLSSAFTKLGVRSRHEAVSLILDPGQGLRAGILSIIDESPPSQESVAS